MPRASKIQYNSSLTVAENAKNNGVSVAAIRYYIKTHDVDRRFERKLNVIDDCQKYLKKHPEATWDEMQKGTGHSLSTMRKYREFIITGKMLTDFDNNKSNKRQQKHLAAKEQQVAYLDTIPTDVIVEYLSRREGKQTAYISKLKAQIDACKEAEKQNSQALQCLPPPTIKDLTKWEEYDASKYLCYAFRKKSDKRKGVWIPFGNMNAGFPFDLCGHNCMTSEAAYICGMFSNDTPEHIAIQAGLLKQPNGKLVKGDIRHHNEHIAREDWLEFNVQWMLYVVWQKVLGNEEFRNLLRAVPEGAIIIEDTTFQKGSQAKDNSLFWGAKNTERKGFATVLKKYIDSTVADKQGAKTRMLLDEFNSFTDFGTFRGRNVMGKILTICRHCLQDRTEPNIDFNLLREKKIHILGKELSF